MNFLIQKQNQFPFDNQNRITKEQDQYLLSIVEQNAQNDENKSERRKWKFISKLFHEKYPNSNFLGKQIKNHYNNTLNPNLKKSLISKDEEKILLKYLQEFGCKYRIIAKQMGRTENSIKNYFHKKLKRKLTKEEINKFSNPTQFQDFKELDYSPQIFNFEETIDKFFN
jgi:predicted nucleotidyltransferase